MKKAVHLLLFVIIVTLIACGGGGGNGGNGNGGDGNNGNNGDNDTPVPPSDIVRLSGITVSRTEVTIEWDYPVTSRFDHADITCLDEDGATVGQVFTINKGAMTSTITGLDRFTMYTINVLSVDTGDNYSEEKKFCFKTAPGSQPIQYITIKNETELASISNNPGGWYLLMANIDLRAEWSPIGTSADPFSGVFVGNGYTISNLKITNSNDNQGLFGIIKSSTTGKGMVTNLTIENGAVNCDSYGGLIAGQNEGIIQGCTVSGKVTGTSSYGGLVGINEGEVKDCKVAVDSNGAGLAANNSVNGKITGCSVTGTVTGNAGLVGSNNGEITNCYVTATVTGSGTTGGFATINRGKITDCYTAGTVTGGDNTGGFVAINAGEITDCYAAGTVTGGDNTGGFVGTNDGKITKSYATGNATGSNNIGGFAGYGEANSEISNCFARGNVTGSRDYVGGFCGTTGIGALNRCCFACGNVAGRDYVGGFCGQGITTGNLVFASRCYSIGLVIATSSSLHGGFAGHGDSVSTQDCFYNKYTSGQSDTNCSSTGLSTSEMKDSSNYTNWDFGNLYSWNIDSTKNGGYPYLVGVGQN